jgi:hypothetical protein
MGRKGEVEASTAGKTFKAAAKAANSAADSLIVPAAAYARSTCQYRGIG